MSYTRINGCGITVSPVPKEGVHSISMEWFTILFIPILPLGFLHVIGRGGRHFKVVKRVSFSELRRELPIKNIISIFLYPLLEGVFLSVLFIAVYAIAGYLSGRF